MFAPGEYSVRSVKGGSVFSKLSMPIRTVVRSLKLKLPDASKASDDSVVRMVLFPLTLPADSMLGKWRQRTDAVQGPRAYSAVVNVR